LKIFLKRTLSPIQPDYTISRASRLFVWSIFWQGEREFKMEFVQI